MDPLAILEQYNGLSIIPLLFWMHIKAERRLEKVEEKNDERLAAQAERYDAVVSKLDTERQEIQNQIQDLNNTNFSKRDVWMGRTISSLVKIGWSEEEVSQRAMTMASVCKKILLAVKSH